MVECCDQREDNFFSYDYNPDVIGPSGTVSLTVRNGCGPFTWASDNGDFTFDDGAETAARDNLIYAAADAGNELANITVTDVCSNIVGGVLYCRTGIVAGVKFSRGSDIYWDDITLTSDTDGATIKYTTDGSNPTLGSDTYSSTITITEDTRIKAFAYKIGLTKSGISNKFFSFSGLIIYISNSTMYTERWYDYSSTNLCEMIDTSTTIRIENEDVYLASGVTKCGLLFYQEIHRNRNLCVLFESIITTGLIFQGAILRLYTNGSASYRELSFRLYGNDVANAVIPSSYDDFFNKTLTTDYSTIDWADSYTSDESFDFDVTDSVKEIIARGDWASENDLQILCTNVSGSSLSFHSSSYYLEELRPKLLTYWS